MAENLPNTQDKQNSQISQENKNKLSLIEELPLIVKEGRKEVAKILARLESDSKITLQTNEFVLPKLEKSVFNQNEFQELDKEKWHNRLIYGDNLLAMQGLLLGDKATNLPSMRGKIDLIYIDPPYDSKADYRTKISLPNSSIEQRPNVLEQFAYSDTWRDGSISYLKMIYPRLMLMRELLSEKGSIYVHLDWHIGHYVKILLDDIFGKENFRNEIIWRRSNGAAHTSSSQYFRNSDSIFYYTKTNYSIFTQQFKPYSTNTMKMYKYDDNDGRGAYRLQELRDYSEDSISKMDAENKIYRRGDKRYFKQYLTDKEGTTLDNIWEDLPSLQGSNAERLNYATQKPEALIERIIKASSVANERERERGFAA